MSHREGEINFVIKVIRALLTEYKLTLTGEAILIDDESGMTYLMTEVKND